MAKMFSDDAARRIAETVQWQEGSPRNRRPLQKTPKAPYSAQTLWAKLTSLTTSSGYYPATWWLRDDTAGSWTDTTNVIWVFAPNGDTLALSTFYPIRESGTFAGPPVAPAYAVIITAASGGGSGGIIGRQIFTSGGTYTPTAGATAIYIELVGGGGGSGGVSGGASEAAASGGGGGGQYVDLFLASISGTYTVTVGAGGAAGTNSPGNGGTGGNSQLAGSGIGSLIASGGSGSLGAGPQFIPGVRQGALGGQTSTDGDTQTAGGAGQAGWHSQFSTVTAGSGGNGGTGAGHFGGSGGLGGQAQAIGGGTYSSGTIGKNYGGGGGGSLALDNFNGVGLAGAPGIVVITEFT